MNRDAPCEKLWDQEVYKKIIKDILAQPFAEYVELKGLHEIVLVSYSIAKGTSCSHNLSWDGYLHHHFIQVNDVLIYIVSLVLIKTCTCTGLLYNRCIHVIPT